MAGNSLSRFAQLRLEIEAIKEEAQDPTLSVAQKQYLINRLVEFTGELGQMALAKMQRGDRV